MQKTISLGNKKYKYTLFRSNRKTITIKISKEKGLCVYVPKALRLNQIESLLREKESWIINKTEMMNTISTREYKNGDSFYYLGDPYRLIIDEQASDSNINRVEIKLQLVDNTFKVLITDNVNKNDRAGFIRSVFEKWYRKKAREEFSKRLDYYSTLIGVRYNRLFIKDQKTRWGSCSSKSNINLNYRLIMAPLEVVDYVIIHELIHLIEMNHSKTFWEYVSRFDPCYKQHRKWLKDNGHLLTMH